MLDKERIVDAERNFAKTSLERASAFVAEIRNILKAK